MIEDVNKKIPNTSDLVRKADYNTKTTKIEIKIPSSTDLVTTAVFDTKATDSKTNLAAIRYKSHR